MAERLFGDNIKPACKYCEHARRPLRSDKLLCDKQGIVSDAYKCRSFIYNPLLRVPAKPKPLEKFEQSDFEL